MSVAANLLARWQEAWPRAIDCWSRYIQLADPRWCLSAEEVKQEGLSQSFAMIRLADKAVVINLQAIAEKHLEAFPLEILDHEIGHHVLCPADLNDHGRMLARMRRGLPSVERHAPMVANLYSDLLINDRLQRTQGLDMAGVFRRLQAQPADPAREPLWTLYLRIYEILWALPGGTLAARGLPGVLEGDAQLGAQLVRVYGRDWLAGAGRFACLCLRYLEDALSPAAWATHSGFDDLAQAASGGEPFGLIEIEDGEEESVVHPSRDPLISGLDPESVATDATSERDPHVRPDRLGGGKENRRFRDPFEYGELLGSLGFELDDEAVAMRYYRERAAGYLIPFPVRESLSGGEPTPEGWEPWDVGMEISAVDWLRTITGSPHVVPGITTVQQFHSVEPAAERGREPMDLYVGIDCSGSMPNPRQQTSYPVLAGVIVALSCLRAGGRVMACLSGEPGQSVATPGFVRSEREILKLLCGYLGSGYTFGIRRLEDMLAEPRPRPVHVLLLSDNDIFAALDDPDLRRGSGTRADPKHQGSGWSIARRTLAECHGGGTMVLNLTREFGDTQRLRDDGWQVELIAAWPDVVEFARGFARRLFAPKLGRPVVHKETPHA